MVSYDGEFYRVDTKYGLLTIDSQGVRCSGAGCPNLDDYIAEITLSGTPLLADSLVPALIQAFADRSQYELLREVRDDTRSTFVLRQDERVVARLELRATSTSEGFADLIAEVADIALVFREPTAVERNMAETAGVGDLLQRRQGRVVAIDGIVAIKSPSMPVRDLSLQDMSDIFSGQVTNWANFGGSNLPIDLVYPADTSGALAAFQATVMDQFEAELTAPSNRFSNLEDLADHVSRTTGALGLTTLSQIGNADVLALTGSCGFKQRPNLASVRNEDYPFALPLMFYTPARRLPLVAREFIEFVASPSSDTVIRRAGLVDQSVRSMQFRQQGDRLALAVQMAGEDVDLSDLKRLVDALGSLERLSTTFRFRDGAVSLDAKSRENVLRLAKAMELGVFDGRELVFVGFSDSEGPASANLVLSQRRAEAVLNLVRETARDADLRRIKLSADAHGEALPMACDDTSWGRAINRRVEVWLK